MPEGTETAEAPAADVTPESEVQSEDAPKGAPTQADIDRLQKALEAERSARRDADTRAKANAEAAKQIQEMEDASKSETQKLTDKLARSDARVAELEAELARERIARRHGLTDAQVKRLIGETEEELEADAQELVQLFRAEVEQEEQEPAETNGHRQPPSTPRPALKSGTQPPVALNDDKMLADVKRKLGIK
jgi:hypothetical protein